MTRYWSFNKMTAVFNVDDEYTKSSATSVTLTKGSNSETINKLQGANGGNSQPVVNDRP